MKMDKVAGSGNDEFYTPKYAITPIIKYLVNKKFKTIWCPFDSDDSLFVKYLINYGFKVINTHIDMKNGDFFNLIKDDEFISQNNIDAIVSNPPYSLKTEVLQALFNQGTPFAMLLGVVGIFESQNRFEMFRNNKFEVMYMNRRIDYFKDYSENKPSKNPPFSSVYITSNILPKQIVFETIDKKDLF